VYKEHFIAIVVWISKRSFTEFHTPRG